MKKAKQWKKDNTIKEIFSFKQKTKLQRPLIGTDVSAGFPSPAQDYIDATLDLNEFLIQHPAATYFIRVDGNSMINAGIHSDDILIVDRAIQASHNKIVIAVLDGELTVKRLQILNKRWYLVAENPDYEPIEITEESDLVIWGVATCSIHMLK